MSDSILLSCPKCLGTQFRLARVRSLKGVSYAGGRCECDGALSRAGQDFEDLAWRVVDVIRRRFVSEGDVDSCGVVTWDDVVDVEMEPETISTVANETWCNFCAEDPTLLEESVFEEDKYEPNEPTEETLTCTTCGDVLRDAPRILGGTTLRD
jgi:hypothetical protein